MPELRGVRYLGTPTTQSHTTSSSAEREGDAGSMTPRRERHLDVLWLSGDSELGFLVENVNAVHVETQRHPIANVRFGARINPRHEGPIICEKMQEDLVSHELGDIHRGFDAGFHDPRRQEARVVDSFRANADTQPRGQCRTDISVTANSYLHV